MNAAGQDHVSEERPTALWDCFAAAKKRALETNDPADAIAARRAFSEWQAEFTRDDAQSAVIIPFPSRARR